MTCSRCRKTFTRDSLHCPHCGQPNPAASGVAQTSIVLISAEGEDLVYRTVDEVPSRLRTKLLRSTNGSNSATILIADRRGRKQVAKALRGLSSPAQRRLIHRALAGGGASAAAEWFTPARKRAVLGAIMLLAGLLTAAVLRLHG